MSLAVSWGDFVPELLCLPIMDPCCVSCSGCPFPIPQNHRYPTGVPGSSRGASISHQSPPVVPGAEPLWPAVSSVMPSAGYPSITHCLKLDVAPIIGGGQWRYSCRKDQPSFALFAAPRTPKAGWGLALPPPIQGCPRLPANGGAATPSAGQGGSVCTLSLCTQLPKVTITLPC